MNILKSLLFLIFVPGVIVGFVPFAFLLSGPYIETGFLTYIAFPFWVIGGVVLLWCFWDFIAKGRGTPAPIDPPKELVATGLYRFVRNPMYVAVLLMLFSEFLWFGYLYLLAYMALFFVVVHMFVMLYEEPTLKKKFGKSYANYLNTVPRWIPKFKR